MQGRVGLHLLQAVRPILILDEPQNMASKARVKALASLNPLAALRYSATHREPYNIVYRLTPFDAYREGLVKKIEVASVVKEHDFNQVFVCVKSIAANKNSVTAKIAVHQRMAGGEIKEKAYTFKPGGNLESKAERSEYASFTIDEINPGTRTVQFANGIALKEGERKGPTRKRYSANRFAIPSRRISADRSNCDPKASRYCRCSSSTAWPTTPRRTA